MDGEGMQLSYTLHFKGSKRCRLIKQQTLINIQQKNLTKYTGMDTEFELQWQKSKDKYWQGCFDIDSMFRTSVHCFFSSIIQKLAKGKQKLLQVGGRFDLLRVGVSMRFKLSRVWISMRFELVRLRVIGSQL